MANPEDPFKEDPFRGSTNSLSPPQPTSSQPSARVNRRLFSTPPESSPPHLNTETTPHPSFPKTHPGGEKMSPSNLDIWLSTLKDRPAYLPILPFATRGFRDPNAPPSFHRHTMQLTQKQSSNMHLQCVNQSYSEKHFGLAALQILLTRLTGTDDFIIGLGRKLENNKGDIMPVRFKNDIHFTVRQLLERIEEIMQTSTQYMHTSVKDLLSELGVSRQTLVHQVSYGWGLDASDELCHMDVYLQHAQDLVLVVREGVEGVYTVVLGLDGNNYDEKHAELIAHLYARVLDEMDPESDTEIGDVEILDAGIRERSMVLGRGPDLATPVDSVLAELQEVAEKTPDQVAVKDRYGNELSYVELARRTIAMSTFLVANGVTKGSPVCVLGPPTIEILCSVFAIWCAGAIYVPMNHLASAEHNNAIVNNCRTTSCVVSMRSLVSYAQSFGLDAVFHCEDMQFVSGTKDVSNPAPSDFAVAIHISASNGMLNGAILTQGNLSALVASMRHFFAVEKPVVLQHSNWSCDLSLFQMLFALMAGGTVYLAPAMDPADSSKIMSKQQITVTIATPSEYSTWFRQPLHTLKKCKSWKFAFSCGENMSSHIVRSFAALAISKLELISVYGTTEAGIACCTGVVDYTEYAADTEGKFIPVGSALPQCQIWIGDHNGWPLPPGWTGDIWVSGTGVGPGYCGPSADDHRFRTHPDTDLKCFRTGDWGFINDTGVLFVVSRRLEASVAEVGGHYVELGDISCAIVDKSNGRVAEAVVVMTNDSEPQVQAFVVMAEAPNAGSTRYLQVMLRGLDLPAYMRPTRIVIRELLPLTPNGIVNRHALMAIPMPEHQIVQVVQPASSFGRNQHPIRGGFLPSTEQKVLRLWEEFLPEAMLPKNITGTTDFFSIGGTTSILSKMLDRMRVAFRETLTIADLAHNPTLRGMTTVALNKISIFSLGGASIDWKFETALPMTKGPEFGVEPVKTEHALTILLTGATGFLGHAILENLVNASEVALIHCVAVRSLDKTIQHPKIIYHAGDLAKVYFGLSESDWNQLGCSVDVIVHAAALADYIRPYLSLGTSNVLPTKKLVQLAAPRQIPTHFISSAGVSRFVGQQPFPEMALARYSPPADIDGYTASKWASEVILERAQAKLAIPVMIHRPTSIVGANVPPTDLLANMFHFAEKLRAVPALQYNKGAFDVMPVEVVARTVVRDALQPIKGIGFSNLGGVKRFPIKDLHLALGMDKGIDMKRVPLQQWVSMARQIKNPEMIKEAAHLFEEFNELVKVVTFPDIKGNRDLA